MRNKIPALVADLTNITKKSNHWTAEAKRLLHAAGPASPETKRALSLARLWAAELEKAQDLYELESDDEEVAYHTEYAPVD
jgi:hypothetical protein